MATREVRKPAREQSFKKRKRKKKRRVRRNADDVIDLLRVRVSLRNNNLKLSLPLCASRAPLLLTPWSLAPCVSLCRYERGQSQAV